MCTNQRLVKSRYMRRSIYVPCGHCPACLQQKAARRVYRIHNHGSDDKVCFMIALTYSRGTSPYIDRTEAFEFSKGERKQLNIYRDCLIRKVRKPLDYNDYNQVYKRVNQRFVLDTIDYVDDVSFAKMKDMSHEFGKISVSHYKDYQQFVARYRLNLKRHYNYDKPVSFYGCQEYGVRSNRSHFHLLLFGCKADKEILRSAVYESWPFSDLRRFPRAIEEAFNASSYVASYVNQPSSFPPFFKTYFKSKHSYSKGFGLSSQQFSLSSVLSAFNKGSLTFNVLKLVAGFPTTVTVPFPKYVINRYFPTCKGYNRFSPSKVCENIRRIVRGDYETESFEGKPKDLVYSTDCFGTEISFLHIDGINYTYSEIKQIRTTFLNAWSRFIRSPLPSEFEYLRNCDFSHYIQLHYDVWRLYHANVLRLSMENWDLPLVEHYDNWDYVFEKGIKPVGINLDDVKEIDPNKYSSTIRLTSQYEKDFYKHIKHRSVSNEIYLLDAQCEL